MVQLPIHSNERFMIKVVDKKYTKIQKLQLKNNTTKYVIMISTMFNLSRYNKYYVDIFMHTLLKSAML